MLISETGTPGPVGTATFPPTRAYLRRSHTKGPAEDLGLRRILASVLFAQPLRCAHYLESILDALR